MRGRKLFGDTMRGLYAILAGAFVEEQNKALESINLWLYHLNLHADKNSNLSSSSTKLKMDFKNKSAFYKRWLKTHGLKSLSVH